MSIDLTQQRLKQLVSYNPETGIFCWIKTSSAGRRRSDIAGNLKKCGHISIMVDGRKYQAHRLAWLYITGNMPDRSLDIDHKNLNPSDNRFSNLRLATRNQNSFNIGLRKNNTSGYKGVSFDKIRNKWISRIRFDGRRKHLGYYDTPEEAYNAYKSKALIEHDEFARL